MSFPTPPSTIPDILRLQAQQSGTLPALCYLAGEAWERLSFNEYWNSTQSIARAFAAAGLRPGDRVGILMPNCVEWELAHMGALAAGAIVVGMDSHDIPQRLQYVAAHADVNAIVARDRQTLEKCGKDAIRRCKLVVLREPGDAGADYRYVAWKAFSESPGADAQPPLPAPDDPATIIYTSGTTGEPKGIRYSHEQILTACRAIAGVVTLRAGERSLCWLPLSNLFQRIVNLCALYARGVTYIAGDPFKVLDYAQQTRPNVFVGVPRFYEKFQLGMEKELSKKPWPVRALVRLAIAAGRNRVGYLRENRRVPMLADWCWRMADRAVLRKLRGALGGEVRFMVSGSAPIAPRILEFFHALGMPLLEAYGTSENVVPIAMNTLEAYRIGSVGKVLAENTVKMSDEGEILVQGRGLCAGYYKDAGRPFLSDDGFYASGDLGEFDDDGFLFIKGRKGDIIKTSGGRRIAPAWVESQLRELPYIDHILVVGNGRKRLMALLTLDSEAYRLAAAQHGITLEAEGSPAAAESWEWMAEELQRGSAGLPRYAQPAGYLILSSRFSIESGELTANLKLKRRAIADKYAADIEQFYAELERDDSEVQVRFASVG